MDGAFFHSPESVISRCATWHFDYRSIVMEELGLQALHRRVAGIDVHRLLHVVTVQIAKNVKLGMIGDAKHEIDPKPEINMLSRLIST